MRSMKINASDLPVLTGRETSLPDVCIHPEHGICITRRSTYAQQPSSWKDLTWRAPEHPPEPRSVNLMTDRQMARLGGLIDHIGTHIRDLVAKNAMGPKRLGSISAKYRTAYHGHMLIGQWRGVMPTPPFLMDKAGPTCRFRLQDRIGRWAIYLDHMSARRIIASVDVPNKASDTPTKDPLTILKGILSAYGDSMSAPRGKDAYRPEHEAIAHRIMCSLLTRMETSTKMCMIGNLSIPRQCISGRGDVMIAWSDRPQDRSFFNLSPRLQDQLRPMLHADVECRVIECERAFNASMGLPAWFQIGNLPDRPTAMEILRHSVHDDGSPQVLVGPDPTVPSHPVTEWLVPIGDARILGLPRIPEIIGETPTT